jgi:hypothetical protein
MKESAKFHKEIHSELNCEPVENSILDLDLSEKRSLLRDTTLVEK